MDARRKQLLGTCDGMDLNWKFTRKNKHELSNKYPVIFELALKFITKNLSCIVHFKQAA